MMSTIRFNEIAYDDVFIADHIMEFKDCLDYGLSPYDFERRSVISDICEEYIDGDEYDHIHRELEEMALEGMLWEDMDGEERAFNAVEEFLTNYEPNNSDSVKIAAIIKDIHNGKAGIEMRDSENTYRGPFGEHLTLEMLRYGYYDNLALQLYEEDEPYCTLTVNLIPLPDGFVCLDTNNAPWAEDFMTENDLGRPTGEYIHSGFCQYPVYELSEKAMAKVQPLEREEVPQIKMRESNRKELETEKTQDGIEL